MLRDKTIFEENNITNFDPNGELNLTINASIAQEKSRQLSNNVKWGKDKMYRQGITIVPYSHFLGYDKLPTDPTIGFIINEEEAKIVRRIYQEFLKGKTPSAICRLLESDNIKSPAGKDTWHPSTVRSILTNEKYKGDAHIRKYYVKDFLTHELVKNNGEVESFYVTKHHEPIVSRADFELVQREFQSRRKLGISYNSINTFSGKVFCGDCKKLYGLKVWHSTSKYRKEVYQCNAKFKNKCKTPSLTEDDIKALFLKAYQKFIVNKAQVIEATKEMIEILCNTTPLITKLNTLNSKSKEIVVLVESLIQQNASKALNTDEFEKRYYDYDNQYNTITEKITNVELEIQDRKSKAKCLKAFVEELEKRSTILKEFDEDVWCYLVEKAIVYRDGTVGFVFRNGVEAKIE